MTSTGAAPAVPGGADRVVWPLGRRLGISFGEPTVQVSPDVVLKFPPDWHAALQASAVPMRWRDLLGRTAPYSVEDLVGEGVAVEAGGLLADPQAWARIRIHPLGRVIERVDLAGDSLVVLERPDGARLAVGLEVVLAAARPGGLPPAGPVAADLARCLAHGFCYLGERS